MTYCTLCPKLATLLMNFTLSMEWLLFKQKKKSWTFCFLTFVAFVMAKKSNHGKAKTFVVKKGNWTCLCCFFKRFYLSIKKPLSPVA